MSEFASGLPGVSVPNAPSTPAQRSAVANGSRLFAEPTDMRSAQGRRYRDLIAAISSDMGGDLSEAQKQLVRRVASLSVWCESVEARLAVGEDVPEFATYVTASNSLRRLLQDVGYSRVAKDVTPTIDQLIAASRATRV